ncbi:RagB/SusD family nutrient uptake outer membrane protein [Sphingobacterium psychroaquaticum]|uniref:RagB/SusD family nutrient uptake outer membrane protein n=1 Tax=Sphingobacterium psychroaquaticum TaxID=561061 RepID=UPI00106BE5F0|nr:RagB/SusD family nutrient uptake outer membrane protein [Sphingobacterium psychroaquaticum]QBQ42632.1 RagB/SusD family nutrient uptake outer membrane protein [Sphingobacterium psychroaquaticum]
MKKFLYISSILVGGCLALISCNDDFLERKLLDKVQANMYFEKPLDLEIYMNQFYSNALFPKYQNHGNDFDSDNEVGATVDTRLQGTRTVVTTGTIGFGNVRSLNYFLNNYKKVEGKHDFNTYKQYVGEAYYFKAVTYFNLLKVYGDIPWLDKDLGTTSPELFSPRTPRNIVADRIIGCLDTAAMYLSADRTNGYSRINKWMALLMQSRVALYEGSWQKYHNGTVFGVTNANPEKYFEIAVKASEAVMASGLYTIYNTGKPTMDYFDLFTRRDYTNNPEVLFWRRYDNQLSRGDGDFTNDRNFRMSQPSGKSITKEMTDQYLCTDGKAITGNSLFQGYATINKEFENRDPRLRQTVATPDQVWKIAANGTSQNWSVIYNTLNGNADLNAPSGYIIQKGYDPHVIYHVQQYEETPSILFRYAEVLLNYVEAKAELGSITQTDIDKTIKLLRARAGMPNLLMGSIANDPKWDFPSLSPLLNEIRRERRVELVGEGFRWDDIARWAAADELIVGKRPKGFLASQIVKNPFPVDQDGFLDPFQKAVPIGYGFKLDRDYLNSIPESEIVLNNKLKQNPGW